MKVAFLINDLQLSGGGGVILEHARQLATRHEFDVTLVLTREREIEPWAYEQLNGAHLIDLETAATLSFDVAVSTFWMTNHFLFDVPATRYAYFVQSLEDRFYSSDEPERLAAALTLDLPVAFITEASWIADSIAELRPDAPVYLVRNGIDKAVFSSPPTLEPRLDGPLRVLVEGHLTSWFKHVPEALHAASLMREPNHVTLVNGARVRPKGVPYDAVVGPLSHTEMAAAYARCDVVLKLSSVEGMFGPPLEGMHMGATCVVTPVTGHEEYVRHGHNGLICDWDDPRGTARALDLLARDRVLLHELCVNALATANAWPSWEQQSEVMATALGRVLDGPAPDPNAASRALMVSLRSGTEISRLRLRRHAELAAGVARLERLKALPVIAPLRRRWRSPWVQRRIAPLLIGALKRASGRG